jgi:hypothetical protein
LRRQYFALKSLIRNHDRLRFLVNAAGRHAFQLCSAPPTFRFAAAEASFVYTVFRFAVIANNDYLHALLSPISPI